MPSRSTCEAALAVARGSGSMSRGARASADPLEVQPRWLVHAGFVLALVVAVAAMVALRRGDLDADEDLLAAGVLALSFWIFALGLGSLVRNVRAGYALRLDAAGLHVPGLDVVPWRAIHDAHLRSYESGGKRFRQLIVHVEPGYSGVQARHYERFLFGPVAGLVGKRGTIAIPVHLLAIDAESLLARALAFIGMVEVREGRRETVAASARERSLSGRRLP
jgi:hypothetical protein